MREVCGAWGMESVYDEEIEKLEQAEIAINNRVDGKRKLEDDDRLAKRGREEEDNLISDDVVVVNVSFVR